MKVKELIEILQKCDQDQIINASHGEIIHVCYLIYIECPPELCLLDSETYEDMIEHDWPTLEEVK